MPNLPPGNYLIELEFERPINYGTLHSALEKMGFIRLTPDDTAAATIGAVTLKKRKLPSTASRTAAAARIAPKPVATSRPAVTSTKTNYAAVAERAQKAGQPPAIVNALRAKAGLPPISNATTRARPAALNLRKKPITGPSDASTSRTAPTTLKKRKLSSSPEEAGLKKRKKPGQTPDTSSEETASDEGSTYGGYGGYGGGGGGGGGGGDGGYSEEGAPEATSSAEPVNAPAASSVVDLWRRWREWGSPFASGPSVSGLDEPPMFRFRFIAQLTNPLEIQNQPGMRWIFVRKLGMNPFGDLNFNFEPHELERGARYELRFLSRSRAMPTRDDVKKGLVDMGFAPMKLSLMQNNMRVPHRAGNSVAMWYGIARWEKGRSTLSPTDPFHFLNVNKIPG